MKLQFESYNEAVMFDRWLDNLVDDCLKIDPRTRIASNNHPVECPLQELRSQTAAELTRLESVPDNDNSSTSR